MNDSINREKTLKRLLAMADQTGLITTESVEYVLTSEPSAETHEERTETHACDCVSRQAAIDALDSFILDETTNLQGDSVREILESLPSAQPDVPDTNVGNMISKQAAIDALSTPNGILYPIRTVEQLPPVQPEPHEIRYSECANAMLKMWIDNVLTDGEYNRIMDKLNAHWAERRTDEQTVSE